MKILSVLFPRPLLALFFLFATSGSVLASNDSAHQEFERAYGTLLAKYWRPTVMINGIETTVFDYAQMANDHLRRGALVDKASAALKKVDPKKLSGNEEKAFWINAYNFGAMRLVVEHYPVDSIRSLKISLIKYPWSKDAVEINGETYSLKQIEKDILLPKFNDPRIVFAVSCAAVSCPDRTADPFSGSKLDKQLDEMVRSFFMNPKKGLYYDSKNNRLTLSWILEKDRHLFSEKEGGVLGFVRSHVPKDIERRLNDNQIDIDYFEHDWTLNDLSQVQK